MVKNAELLMENRVNELTEAELENVNGGIGWAGVAIIAGLIYGAVKGVQETTDYISCDVSGKPFWKHKNENYCDKYN